MELADNKTVQRRDDIDWLRNLGILLLFPFHAARIFDYWEPNYIKNVDLSWGLSWFLSVSAYWFMPLLFLLAGLSSRYALEARTGTQYIKERFKRLFIPFLFGLFIIVPPQAYLARLSQLGYVDNYLQFLKSYFVDFSDLTGYFGTFTPAHLWFILYLFIISMIALPVFLFLKSRHRKDHTRGGLGVLSNPVTVILMFIPLTLTEVLPAPGGKNPFYFLFIFILGYLICTNKKFQEIVDRLKFKAFIFLLCYVPLWFLLMFNNIGASDWAPISILLAFIRNLAVWLTLIVILGYGSKHLNFKVKLLPYMNEAAFPIYILHQTVMMFVGFFIVRLQIGVIPKFLSIIIITFVISLAIYEYLIRRIPVLGWLFGVKTKVSPHHIIKEEKAI